MKTFLQYIAEERQHVYHSTLTNHGYSNTNAKPHIYTNKNEDMPKVHVSKDEQGLQQWEIKPRINSNKRNITHGWGPTKLHQNLNQYRSWSGLPQVDGDSE